MRIAILGAGKMGVWFAKFFLEEGYSVVVADRKKEKLEKLKSKMAVETADFVEAVRGADWILVCVSINAIEDVVRKISPSVSEGQIVMDIASIKEGPIRIMHRHIKKALVLGTHPVFGPGSHKVKNKAFVLTPTNAEEEEFADNLKKWLETRRARVFIMSPKQHDKLMSVVLGFSHFVGLVACDTLLEQAIFPETKKVAGTTYRMLLTLAEVTALESPELYAALQFCLPEVKQIERLFMKKVKEWLAAIKQGDQAAIIRRMEQLRAKLVKIDSDYARSYDIMYKMLEATGN